ncbi:MAG: NifU family protein, partial [Gammaproteobacteria bacterium]|nr:NifU family protein [Gammaproteobacteria bacterium]
KPSSGLTNLQRIKRIEALLEEIRPNLRRDRGDVELLEVDGRDIYVKMIGACADCQMAATTLGGIQQHLAEGLGEFIQVLPAEALRLRSRMES